MATKYVQAKKDSWVGVYEFPDGTLCLEGIRIKEDGIFECQRIRFSLEAVKQLIPLMQKWVVEKGHAL